MKIKSTIKRNIFFYFLIIALPIFGFFAGYFYKKTPSITPVEQKVQENPTYITDEDREIMRKRLKSCGSIPETLKYIDGEYTTIEHAMWSPNCGFIAANVYFGPGITDGSGPNESDIKKSGIYIYSKSTGKIEHIMLPRAYQTASFLRWKDDDRLIFTFSGQPQQLSGSYEISSDQVQSDLNRLR